MWVKYEVATKTVVYLALLLALETFLVPDVVTVLPKSASNGFPILWQF
jgi:hypothetical protein